MNASLRRAITVLACSALALAAGCERNPPSPTSGASVAELVGDSTAPASAPATNAEPAPNSTAAYTPPTAAQLISLLAPVAVFPDKLIAQVLAASEYPDQISDANAWLGQHPALKGDALRQAIDSQTWDPAVKSVVVFPEVLHQMASNIGWTRALGEAYVNDPNDVMNAIQALRSQALASNKLKSDDHISVTQVAKNTASASEQYVDEPQVYSGPPVIPPPDEVVQIAPAQADYVYVPYIDPASAYGTPIDFWPGYAWAWPAPVVWGPGFAFGFGVWIGGFGHWGWGWNHWDIGWGRGFDRHWGGYGWRNASVVFNNRPYVGNSSSIPNHFSATAAPFAGDRAAADPGGLRTAAAARASAASSYAHLSTPHFTSAMVEHSALEHTAGSTVRTFSSTPVNVAASARNTLVSERPGALPSSRYAPASVRGAESAARSAGSYAGAVRAGDVASASRFARANDSGARVYREPDTGQRNVAAARGFGASSQHYASAHAATPHVNSHPAAGGHSNNHRR